MYAFKASIVAPILGYASFALAACSSPDLTPATCQTSGGSPKASDCQAGLAKLTGQCFQSNNVGSNCQTMVTVGTCKLDVCGWPGTSVLPGVNCGGYFQTILNSCTNGDGLVGGLLSPEECNLDIPLGGPRPYRLQFSHSWRRYVNDYVTRKA